MLYYVINHSWDDVNIFFEKFRNGKMYQYILFDLDGTLTDPKEGITKSVQHALKSFGITENNLSLLEPFIGPPLKESFMNFYSMTEEEALKAVEVYRERFSEKGLYENEVYPGIDKLLAKLKEEGKHLAVASSKPTFFVNKILKYFSLDKYFDVVMGSELDGTRVKKEEVITEALKQLTGSEKPDTSNIVMVGDRKFDVEGAKAFSMTSVGVRYGYAQENELEEAGADYIVSTVKELEKLLLRKKDEGNKKPTVKKPPVKPCTLTPVEKIWGLLLPVFLYYLLSSVFIFLSLRIIDAVGGMMSVDAIFYILMHEKIIVVTVNGIGMLFGLFFVRRQFLSEVYWNGEPISIKLGGIRNLWLKEEAGNIKNKWQLICPAVLLAITSCVAFNLIMGHLNLAKESKTYTDTAAAQYSVPIWLGLILYGIISPLAEEAIFRGILYNRMKRYYSKIAALLVTSFLFGFYHLNLVQGIYGTIMGLLLAFTYERTKSFVAPVLFHAAANITVFLLTKNEMLSKMLSMTASTVVFSVLTVLVFVYFHLLTRNNKSIV